MVQLEAKYAQQGLSVLLFPCNQFASQEPGTLDEIASYAASKGATIRDSFSLFDKIEVNGPGSDPLFKFLRHSAKGFLGTTGIKWNYTKFLCDRQGRPVVRLGPNQNPMQMEPEMQRLLAQ